MPAASPARATRLLSAAPAARRAAARCLAAGGLAAFPTETVYGLGADGTNAAAVARLYAAKARPEFNPLIAHVGHLAAARELVELDELAERLAAAFWPGPLTIVAPKTRACQVCELATAGLHTLAVRVPAHVIVRDILKTLARPIVAPSANRSGHVSPTRAAHVLADLGGRIDLIIDGGPAPVGLESTIVACEGATPMLLRPGGIAREAIETVLGCKLVDPVHHASPTGNAPAAPGLLPSHYAPKARLRLNARQVDPGEALLAFGAMAPPGVEAATIWLNLSATGDLLVAAANLYAHLRTLDASGAATIAVMPVPNEGLGEAINDRLVRAAAPRGAWQC
jgi:L-threonylcarbamoyladenylate synthase